MGFTFMGFAVHGTRVKVGIRIRYMVRISDLRDIV